MPTYNQDKYLGLAIRSVLIQTIPIYEIIVSNDCSTDDTRIALDNLAREIPIIKHVHQAVNLGMVKNIKAVMEMAQGDFIIMLDSDDILRPEYAEQLSNQLILHPDAGYAHTAVQQIDQHGNYQKIRNLSRISGYENSSIALKKAAKGYKVAANIIMFRREALIKVNFAPSPINFANDFYLIASIISAGYGNIYVDKVLAEYRVWNDIRQVRKKRKLIEIIGLNKVITDVLEPAYKARNWSDKPIIQLRRSLAILHSDCLAWSIYSDSEKTELKKAIFELDSSVKVKAVGFLYQKGFGFIIDSYKHLKNNAKLILKGIYAQYRRYTSQTFSINPQKDM
ncbi:MAG TPA: glycosyltransferase family 2 protein [Chitinophagaceae bacterium]|nr:glycosyltransferase family 2 protein [Chitinophagaceae bacterium]